MSCIFVSCSFDDPSYLRVRHFQSTRLYTAVSNCVVMRGLDSVMVRTLDLRSRGRGFDSRG